MALDLNRLTTSLDQPIGTPSFVPPPYAGPTFEQYQIRIQGMPDPDFIAQQIDAAGRQGWEFRAFIPMQSGGSPRVNDQGLLLPPGPPQVLLLLQFQRRLPE